MGGSGRASGWFRWEAGICACEVDSPFCGSSATFPWAVNVKSVAFRDSAAEPATSRTMIFDLTHSANLRLASAVPVLPRTVVCDRPDRSTVVAEEPFDRRGGAFEPPVLVTVVSCAGAGVEKGAGPAALPVDTDTDTDFDALTNVRRTVDPDPRTRHGAAPGWSLTGTIAATAALLFGSGIHPRRPRGVPRQLQDVLDALPDATALFDARGRLTAANDKLRRLMPLEITPQALLGTTTSDVYAQLSPDNLAIERARNDALAVFDGSDPDATLSFQLPSYGRRALLVKERPTADGGLVIAIYGGNHRSTNRFTDPLTALPNRTRLVSDLALRCSRTRRSLALIIVDLRSFRQINDTYGRPAGDELLKQTAVCLQHGMPEDALIARIAGDEFAVLLEFGGGPSGRAVIERRVTDVLGTLRRGLNVDTMNVPVRASVGIAYTPDHGKTVSTLMSSADSACAHAKRLGNNTLVVYDSARQREAKRRHQLEVGLQQAIGRGELSLQYQPQVDIRTKMTCGMEALLRWNHPEFGRVSPADFIPIAEQTGIITRVGNWVLHQAIEDYQRLAQFGMSPAMLSVNLSRKQFDDGRIVHEIADVLEKSGFDPQQLCLEITETALFSDSNRFRDMLRTLTGFGAKLSIDDFGVGYSSLLELKDFPISEVKIDRAFVTDVAIDGNSQDIIRAVVSIADSIGATVVAEGIENAGQFAMISALGCDRGQGYWLCEPMPATTFPDVVLGN